MSQENHDYHPLACTDEERENTDEVSNDIEHLGNQMEFRFRCPEDIFNYINGLDDEIWEAMLPLLTNKKRFLKDQPELEPAKDVRDCPENQVNQMKTTTRYLKVWTKKWPIPATIVVLLCAIFLLLGITLTKNRLSDAPLSPHAHLPCPPHWIWYQGKCFFFSEGEKNWTFSQSFCSSHGGSLARIRDEEKNFTLLLKGRDAFWIGLTRSPGQPWKWLDGENATLEVFGDGGDCAYLDNEFKPGSYRCSTTLRWMCSKLATFEKPD